MKRIRNIVFDLGGVLIDLDHHQAVSRFEEIGVKDAKQLLDPYEQKGFFLELENGKIDVDTFCRKLCEHTGKQLSYDEIKYAWMGFIADVPQYKLDLFLELRNVSVRLSTARIPSCPPVSITHDKICFTDPPESKSPVSWDHPAANLQCRT